MSSTLTSTRILASSADAARLKELAGTLLKSVTGTVTLVGGELLGAVVNIKQGTADVVLPNGAIPLGVLAAAGTLSAPTAAMNVVFTDGTTPSGYMLATDLTAFTTGLSRLQTVLVNGADSAIVGAKAVPAIQLIANNAGAGVIQFTILYI